MMLYVTVELSIADNADDEVLADAIFDVLVSGEWCEDPTLDAMVLSVDGTTYRREREHQNLKLRG